MVAILKKHLRNLKIITNVNVTCANRQKRHAKRIAEIMAAHANIPGTTPDSMEKRLKEGYVYVTKPVRGTNLLVFERDS